MKKYARALLLVWILVASCSSRGPKNIIGIDSMKVYMWDMMRADELYLRILAKDSTASRRKENIRLYQQVLALHRITKGRFDSSYKYYEANPIAFKLLVDSLDAYATREKTKLFSRYGQAK